MNVSNEKLFGIFRSLAISILLFCVSPGIVLADQAVIKKIEIKDTPLSVKLFLSRNVPVKVIQVEKKELLIALKNARLKKGFRVVGKEKSRIKDIAIENLSGNVVALVLTSTQPYGPIQSGFNKAESSFVVSLEKKKAAPLPKKKVATSTPADKKNNQRRDKDRAGEPTAPSNMKSVEKPVEKKAAKKTAAATIPASQKKKGDKKQTAALQKPAQSVEKEKAGKEINKAVSAVQIPGSREQSKYNGDISDLVQVSEDMGCEANEIRKAIGFIKKDQFKEGFEILDQYMARESLSCIEQAHFLRAYAFYKHINADQDNFTDLLKGEQMFQDALVSFPGSVYVPFGYATMGLIHKRMNNLSAAQGYFTIVRQGYLEYPGLPEVIYQLANIYDKKGHLDKAINYYKKVFEDSTWNTSIPDAGIGYGKILFKKRRYLDSLAVLNWVVESSPEKLFESHELLRHIGDANYEVGQSKAARDSLNRALNLFPKMAGKDAVLSKIGDTYGMENKEGKAIKVYELVIEKYPDSQGFISSSIGIARYLKTDDEKIEIYIMIKNKFPDNTYSRIAMMRLAEIYQAKGEYNKCIKEIEDLLSTHPRGLRYEAVKLMQKAYEALFQKQLESDEYTGVLNRYEFEHTRIDRMGSRKIALLVGRAYFQAKLYEEAFNHLINAYKQYKKSSRSPELLFDLGVTMDESGRDEDALKLMNAFSKQYPKSKQAMEALRRSGEIYLDKKQYKLSSAKFSSAYKAAKNQLDKGHILVLHSHVYEKKGDYKTASKLREKAIKEMALAPGENYKILSDTYKDLGGVYIILKKYVKAADSYQKALGLSEDENKKANIGFLLGDAYQKGNILPKAKEAFLQVASLYDSVWAKLARQRLDTIELANVVQNS